MYYACIQHAASHMACTKMYTHVRATYTFILYDTYILVANLEKNLVILYNNFFYTYITCMYVYVYCIIL